MSKGIFKAPQDLKRLPRWKVLEGKHIDEIGYQLGCRINKQKVEVSLYFPADSKSGDVEIFEDTQITKIIGGK